MIKIHKKLGHVNRYPDHLVPVIFKCGNCGCTVRKIEATNSYILMSVHPAIESGKRKICRFCYRLRECNGITK